MATTTVVSSAFTTMASARPKRLSNGWLVAMVRDNSISPNRLRFYKSLDDGITWSEFVWIQANGSHVHSIASKGTDVFVLFSKTSVFFFAKLDATTVPNQEFTAVTQLDAAIDVNGVGATSLAVNASGTELHAAWASKNSTYPNSFNIRYAKGTIDGSGNVTWGVVQQRTALNSTGADHINPCVILRSDGNPVIIYEYTPTAAKGVGGLYFNGSTWSSIGGTSNGLYAGGTYTQSYPCAVVDGNGVIHVVWHGYDSTDYTNPNTRYAKSTDGGSTWSPATKLTSGNADGKYFPSIGISKNNVLYALWEETVGGVSNYRIATATCTNGTWSSVTGLTTTSNRLPSIMEKESGSMIGWIYKDVTGSAVKFSSVVFNNLPTLTLTNPANNQPLSEGSLIQLQGTASDADANNNVVIKCQINSGTIRNIGSGVSNGTTPISFAQTLTYSRKRIYDGTTDMVGADLAEGIDHTLRVWSEDDQGGKSAEVTRKFRVIWNRPPTISGSNADLGTIMEPPSKTYTVTEPENDTFTVIEKINGTVIRTFAGVAGEQETVTISHDQWIRLDLDTPHSLTVEATDSNGLTSTRTYTFSRTETHIEFMLNLDTPDVQAHFILDGMPYRVLLTLERYLPEGAAIESVKVCNNALDPEPAWEDATSAVKGNRGYLFTNTTKTAENWAINIWVVIAKETATERVRLNGYGGAFD